jgi:uncharacterized membrane protein
VRLVYERGSEEFTRVITFSDAIFAIAMTLLVVGIEIPKLDDPDSVGELADALNDVSDSLVSFFISFAVIGRYWVAHHSFFSLLGRMSRRLMASNLVYLAFIAFLPFPTGVLGDFFDNPLALGIYAAMVALVSGLEVVQFRVAYGEGLLAREMPPEVYRWGTLMSLSPVAFFLASVPVAFAAGSEIAVVVWLLVIPFQIVANRHKPARADDFALG